MCLLQEYFKSLGPSQLLAERGREILVINPGSAFFRIGLASQKEPLLVPHCIARYGPELARKRKKVRGGISELEDMVSALRKGESASACSSIVQGQSDTLCAGIYSPKQLESEHEDG